MPYRYTPADDRTLERPDFRASNGTPPGPWLHQMSGGWRWLWNRQTGPVPRIRLAAGVLASSVKERGRWRSLPIDFATALLAPIRVPGPPAPPVTARDWSPERTAAAARLRQAAQRWATGEPEISSFAVIAEAGDLAVWGRSSGLIELRPEDWAVVLEHAEAAGTLPNALLVTSTNAGNHDAWAYRLGQIAHPDAFLQHDVAALVAWFAGRGLPSIFLVTDHGADAVAEWGSVARLFDLVLAPSETVAAGFSARPDRQGIEARVSSRPADLGEIRTALEAVA